MKDFDDALLDTAWKNMDDENNRFKDIDAKAIGIITITGVLVTFLAKPVNSRNITNIFFILTTLSFLVTILFSILVIRVRRVEALSTQYLIEDFKNEKPERQIKGLIGTIAKSHSDLRMACNKKAKDLIRAVYALGFSVISLIFYTISTTL